MLTLPGSKGSQVRHTVAGVRLQLLPFSSCASWTGTWTRPRVTEEERKDTGPAAVLSICPQVSPRQIFSVALSFLSSAMFSQCCSC